MKILSGRKTKIVATLGPASNSRESVRAIIEAGVNVVRMNFSHGTHEDHKRTYDLVREEAADLKKHIAVFVDLCGPKVRIGTLQGGEVYIKEGTFVDLYHLDEMNQKEEGTPEKLYIEAFDPVQVIHVGHKALLADGRILMVATDVTPEYVRCHVISGGKLRSRSGISVPESRLDLPCLTDKDKVDLAWAIENKVDYVALSFVGTTKDIEDAHVEMDRYGVRIPVISKIERASSLDEITGIVGASDAVMVARGDLGLELPLERVPAAQRFIINEANLSGTPVITATQMLMSMVNEIRPTRAEVSDVYTAVRDGTDAVMLSDETAIGNHPIESVRVLSSILLEAEKEHLLDRPSLLGQKRTADDKVADAVCFAASNAAAKLGCAGIIACTESGSTATLMAKYRPQAQVFGATSVHKTLSKMALLWGVEPVLIELNPNDPTMEHEVTQSLLSVRDTFGLKPGSRVVVTVGLRTKKTGSTNVMEVREIPRTN
jgi:pyruvate kinase